MLVGLCGYARSGKDTAADGLPKGFHRFSFARPLKEAADGLVAEMLQSVGDYAKAEEVFTMGTDEFSGEPEIKGVKDQFKPVLRPFYVALGAGMRALIPGYWITKLALEIEAWEEENSVITDVRYLNEAKYILDKGGIVIYIKRPGLKPANAEERRSFKEIREAVKARQIKLLKVDNDSDIQTLQERVNSLITKNTKI